MTLLRRPRTALVALTATLLLGLAVPSVDAYMPRASHYSVGGPITLDTNLLSVSGASAWGINAYLAANTPLPPLGEAFLSAEAKYGVNARFLLAAAMHESGMGTSDIARLKHNLFGYNAYDRNPFKYASAYSTFAANVDATAKFMKDFYLSPRGRWWAGAPTLRSMQRYWSSSGRWGEAVSQIASSMNIPALAGPTYKFGAPQIRGGLHGGDRTTVRLAWGGGAIPTGATFVATWVPVELDADIAASSAAQSGATGAVNAAAAPVAGTLALAHPSSSAAAARAATASRTITLAVRAPRQAGSYLLRVEMRDEGGTLLPAAQRVKIPALAVRVWGDQAVSVTVATAANGSDAVVKITNTGRQTIPAQPKLDPAAAADPEAHAIHSVVTVTAASSGASDSAPVLLLSQALVADLPPGASQTFAVAGIETATGRTTNWLSVGMSVLGDPTLLAAYAPVSAWFSGAPTAVLMLPAAPYDGPQTPPASPVPAAAPVMAPVVQHGPEMPPPSAAPTATPAPTPTATPNPTPTATPTATPATTPKPKPAPVVHHVMRTYAEYGGSMSYRGSWGNASGPYQGGNVAYSTSAGSTASFTFTGSSVSWIGPLGPTRGAALVLIDGRAVTTVSLWRSDFVAQAVLFHRVFKATGQHTITIRVLSAPGHPFVAIDGFVIRT